MNVKNKTKNACSFQSNYLVRKRVNKVIEIVDQISFAKPLKKLNHIKTNRNTHHKWFFKLCNIEEGR